MRTAIQSPVFWSVIVGGCAVVRPVHAATSASNFAAVDDDRIIPFPWLKKCRQTKASWQIPPSTTDCHYGVSLAFLPHYTRWSR